MGLWLFYPETLLLLLPALLLAVYSSYKVRSTYAKYLEVPTQRRVTAAQVVEELLARAGVSGVRIEGTPRPLGDHYDPRGRTLRLSAPNSPSVAAVGVAAHEAGHAIQHAQGYAPLALRSAVVPVASFGSQLAFPLFFIGLIFRADFLLNAGIILFSAAVLFTLITLPVEFNASRRAVAALRQSGLVTQEELGGVKEVLNAAALTYVAAAAMAALQLLSMLLIANRRR
ncbi:MAG: Peptidase membrane zinc metallopeptidase [Acetothermia bacterium 64_32]|nr:MAG: Peptidase membrane zinc metallopeptidase [Acetothermia bacterium 64_32]HAF71397.1 peptidase [Candidatus Acetothermia bacterium]